ncbi:glycyl-radical enzyme activating family protein [Desulfovibrio sp. A2]|nr:glycyl-radical enzyme activating family protein [Desulfovibrio sp. A2]
MQDKEQTGIVFNMQKYSVHDGAGIRTMVFFKGCPLRCAWCSNPESQRPQPERGFSRYRCLSPAVCGYCIPACPRGCILDIEGLLAIDYTRCDGCLLCAQACPTGAMNVYGQRLTVAEVLETVEQDTVFYARSGGGMTLSGGEVMQQPEFAVALLREARHRRINTAMETCGHCDGDMLAEACRHLDSLIFDIKQLDSERHKQGTGVGNERILENFLRVCREFPELPILARTPVIPGFNDTEDDIRAIARFLPKRANLRYELLPYHRMGQAKYEFLGRAFPMGGAQLADGALNRLRSVALAR